jgi:PAS domain S-box-containing protein
MYTPSRTDKSPTELWMVIGLCVAITLAALTAGWLTWDLRHQHELTAEVLRFHPEQALERLQSNQVDRDRQIQSFTVVCIALLFLTAGLAFSLRSLTRHREMLNESQSLAQLSIVAQATSNAVVLLDAAGVVGWTNKAFERLTGYDQHAAAGRALSDLLLSEKHTTAKQELAKAFRKSQPFQGERLCHHRDGNSFWANYHFSPVRDESAHAVRGWVAIGWDTTMEHRARLALETATREAEMASRSKSAFLANLSHEIRTPMNVILGMCELVLDTQLDVNQRGYLTTLESSAESLLDLLNDVLDLSRIEAGRLDLDEIDFNLADLLRETIQQMSVIATQRNLELRWQMLPEVPCWLRGDPLRLRQVLVNLVGNALKFTRQGEVAVGVSCDDVSADPLMISIRVRDTGIGIAPDNLQQIFEAFTQADTSTTRHYGGTGLGLAISSQLVELMNGHIGVESQLEQGSTFHFSVPLQRAVGPGETLPMASANDFAGEPQPPMQRLPNPSSSRPLHVLVADDHAPNRVLAQQVLEKRGHQVSTAQNGEEVLMELDRGAFDIVLMDVQLPVMDGLQATAAIRQRERGTNAHVPIVALTAYAMKGDRERCLEAGMDGYLSKPLRVNELIKLIASLTDFNGAARRDEHGDAAADRTEPCPVAPPLAVTTAAGDIDFARALDRMAGDEDLLHSQMEFFLAEAPHLAEQVSMALVERDAEHLRLHAHRLRGLVATFDHAAAMELAQQLERAALDEDYSDVEFSARQLKSHVQELAAAIRSQLSPR